jgi:ATP:corrinoid adenosyltransferase
MINRDMKRRATNESLAEARPGKRPAVEADTARSSFHGNGLQNSGDGHITVGRDINIGMVLPISISSADGLLGNWKENRSDCQRDLFVTDPYDDKKSLKRKKGGHAPGTCEWILRTKELTAWLGSEPAIGPQRQATQVLWLYGNPGTGKTIMALYLTEELPTALLNMEGAMLAYFFCDSGFHTRKTATSVVRGLLYQLIGQHQQLLSHILPNYRVRGAELFTSFDALWKIFMAMVADPSIGRTYCIIDALDECDKESQQSLLQQLEETFQSRDVSPNVRILVTSRPYPEIRESLQMFPNIDLTSFSEGQRDIDLCIEERVNHLAERKKYTNKVKAQVCEMLRDKAEGTFLWVGLACDGLKDIPSNRVIRVLQDIPKGLNAIYKKLLEMALEQHETSGDDLRRLLGYMAVSSRPLTVSELCEVCQLHQEEEDFETRIQFTHDNIDSCRLLVIIQDEKVLLLHQSVKDYLVGASSGYFINEPEAHARLSYRCVDVLIAQFCSVKQTHTSFSDYATLEWANHARMAKSNFEVQCPQAEFFQLDSPCRDWWLERFRSKGFSGIPSKSSIFHLAATWGISALVDHASDLGLQESHTERSTQDFHVNCLDGIGETPLEQAAGSRYANAVAALLSRGGKVTTQAVVAASGNEGNGKEVMTLLLDRCGDQITITDEVVSAAATNLTNGKEVMTLLLNRCGDQFLPISGQNLSHFAEFFNDEVMALLLDRSRDQIAITDEVVTAAARNIRNGQKVMILLLDRYGDQITITDEVVIAAARNPANGKEVIALLLDRRGNQITITNKVMTAAAGNEGNGKEVMALLLGCRGDQITITDEVVIAAAGNPDNELMTLLLDLYGDQITITDEVVIAAAGNWGNGKEVIALLLDHRGDQITITNEVMTAAAGNWGNGKEVIALLLDRRGDQITITDEVVKAAARNWGDGEEVITLLLDRHGDQITITNEVMTAAAGNLNSGQEVIALLLDRRGDQIPITDEVMTAAAGNLFNGEEVIALLLDRRGDQITITNKMMTAAARNWGNGKEVIALLLDCCGDQITITDEVVIAAAGNSKNGKEVMVLLLDRYGDQITITEEVIKAAAGNPRRNEIMTLLLDRRRDQVSIILEAIQATLPSGNC